MRARPIASLTEDDIRHHPVWEFDLDEQHYEPEQDESWVLPVLEEELPVSDLGNCEVATEVVIANGGRIWALLGNVHLQNADITREFLVASFMINGAWFHMERYFDPWYASKGPKQLATLLGLDMDEVFPIRYDISHAAIGLPEVVKGVIDAEPENPLTDDERWELQRH